MYADFFQYYGVDLHNRCELSHTDAAILCAQLPRDGRVFRAMDPDSVVDYTAQLLRSIELHVRALVWQQTEDGVAGRNQPEAAPMPSEVPRDAGRTLEEDRAFVDRVLGMVEAGD